MVRLWRFVIGIRNLRKLPFERCPFLLTLEPKKFNNAVKYADDALGQFFKTAKRRDYWKDTLFLVVADHDIRVRCDALVSVKHFHIPGFILGADLQPKRIKTVASQIDLPTTLLSLMGISAEHPIYLS
jgi:phosphoglycerol transferase MdoB-like AlkP superfamily enzyme